MSVSLKKGQKVNINVNSNNAVNKIIIGLGWHPNQNSSSHPFDLDASAFLLNSQGKVDNDSNFIFYNNPVGAQGAVLHSGNNVSGSFINDAEQMVVDLSKMPANILKIAVAITIHEANERRQNFGMINNAYIRIANYETNEEILSFDLSNQFAQETAIVAAEIYNHNGQWKFNATGSGFHGGLSALCRNFGVSLAEEVPPVSTPTFRSTGTGVSTRQSSFGSYSAPQQPQSYPVNNMPAAPSYTPSYAPSMNTPSSGLSCPHCHSSRVSGGKKGFGIGKAAVGTLLLGPIGLLGGFIGSNNLEFVCLDCRYKWSPQNHGGTADWLRQQANSAQSVVGKYLNGDLVDSLVAGSAIVSMADGIIEPSEKARLMQYFSTSSEFRNLDMYKVEQRFNYFVQRIQFDNIMGKAEALQAVSKVRNKPDAARLVVRLCCAIAYADGDFGYSEKIAIEEICRDLCLSPQEFISY